MPYLTQPSLTLTRLSNTSFQATVSGDSGNTHRVFYRLVGGIADITGPVIVGSGSGNVTGLINQGQYLAYAIADDLVDSYSKPTIKAVSLASTDSVFGSILAKFNANPVTVALITGGLWTGEVPENIDPPYCFYDQALIQTVPNFEDELEFGSFSFNVYALGYDACHLAVRQLKATFDYQSLTYASFEGSVGIWPISWRIYNEQIRWRDNEQIHRGTINYRLALQKFRAAP